jgi:hypothetical protein
VTNGFQFGSKTCAFVRLNVWTQATTWVHLGHGGNVFAQGSNVDNDSGRG